MAISIRHKPRLFIALASSALLLLSLPAFANTINITTGSSAAGLRHISSGNSDTWLSQLIPIPISISWASASNDAINVSFNITSPDCSGSPGSDYVCMQNTTSQAGSRPNDIPYEIIFTPCDNQTPHIVTCNGKSTCGPITLSGAALDCSATPGQLAVFRPNIDTSTLPNAGYYNSDITITASDASDPNVSASKSFDVNETVDNYVGLTLDNTDVPFNPPISGPDSATPTAAVGGYVESNSGATGQFYIHVTSSQIGAFNGQTLPFLAYTPPGGSEQKLYYTGSYDTTCGGSYDQSITQDYQGGAIGFKTAIPATNTDDCTSGQFNFTMEYPIPGGTMPAQGNYTGTLTLSVGTT